GNPSSAPMCRLVQVIPACPNSGMGLLVPRCLLVRGQFGHKSQGSYREPPLPCGPGASGVGWFLGRSVKAYPGAAAGGRRIFVTRTSSSLVRPLLSYPVGPSAPLQRCGKGSVSESSYEDTPWIHYSVVQPCKGIQIS